MCLYLIVHALVVDLNPELRIMSPLFYHCATPGANVIKQYLGKLPW